MSLSHLLSAITINGLELTNRVMMSAMTRTRCTASNAPTDLTTLYYSQRASPGTVIVTEGVSPSARGLGYYRQPGIWSNEQIDGWKKVVDSVHSQGGKIICQLMHAGRVSDSSLLPNNQKPVAPSAVAIVGREFHGAEGKHPFETPEELTLDGIQQVVNEFKEATRICKEIGFDGIELHGANGYIIHEFLAKQTNQRTDKYGGSVENRTRIVLEIVEAANQVFPGRIAIKLSPGVDFQGLHESPEDVVETYPYLLRQLNSHNLLYVLMSDFFRLFPNPPSLPYNMFDFSRKEYKGTLVLNGAIEPKEADELIAKGSADLVAFGTYYLNNPDFVNRLKNGYPLNPKNGVSPKLYYGSNPAQDHVGYTEYEPYSN